jgi:hypothetical protein
MLIVSDGMELLVAIVEQQEKQPQPQAPAARQELLRGVTRVVVGALGCEQSTRALANLLHAQRGLARRFPRLLGGDEEAEYCAHACARLLAHCAAQLAHTRAQAAASLFLLMRHSFELANNFAQVATAALATFFCFLLDGFFHLFASKWLCEYEI